MFRKPNPRPPDFRCSNCGEWVRGGSAACRECGASDESGWEDQENPIEGSWTEDDEESEESYQNFLRHEHPQLATQKSSLAPHWWWTAFVLLLFILYGIFSGYFW